MRTATATKARQVSTPFVEETDIGRAVGCQAQSETDSAGAVCQLETGLAVSRRNKFRARHTFFVIEMQSGLSLLCPSKHGKHIPVLVDHPEFLRLYDKA
jgi:hypothetical protein